MRHVKLATGKASTTPGFRILTGGRSSQAAVYVLAPGESSSDEPEDEHPASEQWVFVLSGSGRAKGKGRAVKLGEGSLLLIEKREPHQITNTGRGPLVTLNFYCAARLHEVRQREGAGETGMMRGPFDSCAGGGAKPQAAEGNRRRVVQVECVCDRPGSSTVCWVRYVRESATSGCLLLPVRRMPARTRPASRESERRHGLPWPARQCSHCRVPRNREMGPHELLRRHEP